MKSLLLLLLFLVQLFAYEKVDARIKATSYSNSYGHVKVMIHNPMTDGNVNKYRYPYGKTSLNYITHVKIKSNGKLLYSVNLSPYISENPLLKFSYKDIKPLSLMLEYTDNNGTIKTYNKKVTYSNKILEIHQPLKLSKNPKTYPTQIKSIKKLFGNITLIEDGIQLIVPKLAEHGEYVPVYIRSDIKFKSVALFIKDINSCVSSSTMSKKNNEFKLASQWFVTPYSVVNFGLRVKIKSTVGKVRVVLEAENGKFYTIEKEVDVCLGGGVE